MKLSDKLRIRYTEAGHGALVPFGTPAEDMLEAIRDLERRLEVAEARLVPDAPAGDYYVLHSSYAERIAARKGKL